MQQAHLGFIQTHIRTDRPTVRPSPRDATINKKKHLSVDFSFGEEPMDDTVDVAKYGFLRNGSLYR